MELKLSSPIFVFALDVAYGRVKPFETYKVNKPISYEYDIKAKDFAVTDEMFQTFKKFAVEKYKFNAAVVDKEREFVERALRSELVTAAYGTQTSLQVVNDYDNQLLRAIELLPQAKQLAVEGAKANANAAKNRTINK